MSQSDLTYEIIGAAMEIHRELGSGLRESPYENALRNELRIRGHHVEQQKPWPILYKEAVAGDCITDLVVNGEVVVEIKAIDSLGASEEAQILDYLKISEVRLGLLLNFKPASPKVRRLAL